MRSKISGRVCAGDTCVSNPPMDTVPSNKARVVSYCPQPTFSAGLPIVRPSSRCDFLPSIVCAGRSGVQDLFSTLDTERVSSPDMELRLLRYFVAVAEERHVGRAAARLHMTQPPLSRAIRRLEDQLGVAVLQRVSSGVVLTPAGEALLDGARGLLEQADRLGERVTAAAGRRTLVVGTLADAAE